MLIEIPPFSEMGIDYDDWERIEWPASKGDPQVQQLTVVKIVRYPSSTGGVGPQGPKGDTGAPGEKGDTGDAGTDGIPGERGDTGIQGPAGEPGAKGDTGEPAGNLDGGGPDTVYGGTVTIDCGRV